MYEVEITGDHNIYESSGPLGKIRRVFPDLNSMIRFGCRPSPKTFNIPYMGNKENAHVLGYMLCAKSVAERFSGTLSMIDDSAIKIGNPIRFFAYDEHPHKPLASQENGSSTASSWSNMSNQHGYQSLENAQNSINNGIASSFAMQNSDTINGTKYTANIQEQSNKKDNSPEVMGDKAQVENTEQINNTTQDRFLPQGDDINIVIGGKRQNSSYKGLRASYAATTTDAQSIYYVSAIRRNINTNKESTMTLSLTFGRMMGEPSAIDQMMLLYKTYYDTNTGYCPQLSDMLRESKKYRDSGNFKKYEVKANDEIKTIAQNEYGIDISQPPLEAVKKQSDDEKRADKWSTLSLKEAANGEEPWDSQTYDLKWHRRTAKCIGDFYKVAKNNPKQVEKIGHFDVFIYDFDRMKYVYKGIADAGGSMQTTEPGKSPTSETDYSSYVKTIGDKIHQSLGGESGQWNVAIVANLETKPYMTTAAFTDHTEVTNIQKQFDELKYAIIALNEGNFGNSLEQTEEQVNTTLHDKAGTEIVIPKSLIMGRYEVPGKENKETKTDTTYSPSKDPELKQTVTTSDGSNITREQIFSNGTTATYTVNGTGKNLEIYNPYQ